MSEIKGRDAATLSDQEPHVEDEPSKFLAEVREEGEDTPGLTVPGQVGENDVLVVTTDGPYRGMVLAVSKDTEGLREAVDDGRVLVQPGYPTEDKPEEPQPIEPDTDEQRAMRAEEEAAAEAEAERREQPET